MTKADQLDVFHRKHNTEKNKQYLYRQQKKITNHTVMLIYYK